MEESLITDVEIELWAFEFLVLASNLGGALIDSICNSSGNDVGRLHVASVTHLGVPGSIINHDSRELAHFKDILNYYILQSISSFHPVHI